MSKHVQSHELHHTGANCVTPDELKEAVRRTKEENMALKGQLEVTVDPRERKILQRRLKELQRLQLWQLEQLGWETENL